MQLGATSYAGIEVQKTLFELASQAHTSESSNQ